MRDRFRSALLGCCLALLAIAVVGLRSPALSSLHLQRSGLACDDRASSSHALRAAVDVDAVVGADTSVIRRLGGYERLLSRKAPNSDFLSLSHGAAFELDGTVTDDDLVKAAAACLTRHPLLNAYIKLDVSGKPSFAMCSEGVQNSSAWEVARRGVQTVQVRTEEELRDTWQDLFGTAINAAKFDERGPLWRLTNVVLPGQSSAWVFCVNHGIDDQASVNAFVADMLLFLKSGLLPAPHPFPPSIEQAIAPGPPGFKTLLWTALQVYNSLNFPVMIPKHVLRRIKEDPVRHADYADPDKRRTFVRHFSLTQTETARLVAVLGERREREGGGNGNGKLSVTNILAATMLSVTNALLQGQLSHERTPFSALNMRFLLSVALRPFGEKGTPDFTGGTVACASGAVDFTVPVTAELSAASETWAAPMRNRLLGVGTDVGSDAGTVGDAPSITPAYRELFWVLANKCRAESYNIIALGLVPESVRLFGIGMEVVDILQAVEIDARSGSLGRGFSTGVSNMGIVDLSTKPPESPDSPDSVDKVTPSGGVAVVRGYYATSHARNGVLCQLSSMTIGGALSGCLQFASPLTSAAEADLVSQAVQFILRNI